MALLARPSNWFSADTPANDHRPADGVASEDPAVVDDPARRRVEPALGFAALRVAIEPARRGLLDHPLYQEVDSLERLRTFMATHVFAVWDFMCLAKRLQREFTSLEPLWRPPSRTALARFINGVIHGEESDVGPDGEAVSHCELYIGAMDEVGADTRPIRRFLDRITAGDPVEVALAAAGAPAGARTFVAHTLRQALDGDPVEVLAAFLFGREDLIPEMFARLLPRWRESRAASRFTYYVERHIQLDGDDHGPAAQRALIDLTGDDAAAWDRAERAAAQAIAARVALWDRLRAEL